MSRKKHECRAWDMRLITEIPISGRTIYLWQCVECGVIKATGTPEEPSEGLHVFAGDVMIAACGGHSDNFTEGLKETQQANARLIAATPALLEALKERTEKACEMSCVYHGSGQFVHSAKCQKAHAAIAAAEERRICSCEGDGHEDGCVVVERR